MSNKYLLTKCIYRQYVITQVRDGTAKYISRDCFKKHGFKYTSCLDKARKFSTREEAMKAVTNLGINGKIKIQQICIEMTLEQ